MKVLLKVLLFAYCVSVSQAILGVDVSQLFPVSGWSCLVKENYVFAIVRCYRSVNSVDPNCAQSVENAWKGGMKDVGLYMFPCPKCGNITGQVKTLHEYTLKHNLNYSGVWLDVEGKDKYWYTDLKKNQEVFNELCTSLTNVFGKKFSGAYVSHNSWSEIFGLSYKAWGNLKLWYARWNNEPNFSDWTPYGEWTKPNIHQYHGGIAKCDMNVDLNFQN